MIAIIGDVILDVTLIGNVDRISPEAPIPVITDVKKSYSLGGAANVALNIHNLNQKCTLYGAIGNDYYGEIIISLCDEKKLSHKFNIGFQNTTVKKRYSDNRGYYLLREDKDGYFSKRFLNISEKYDIIVASDYGKGIFENTEFINFSKKVLVDTKTNFEQWAGAYLIKPNEKEFHQYFNPLNMKDIPYWLVTHNIKYMLVTQGSKGMTLISNTGDIEFFPSISTEVADVTGAGDTVISVIAVMLARKKDIYKAVEAAIFASSEAVKHRGIYVVSEKDIPKIVFVNGAFDILHAGHLTVLQQARKLGNKLIVGLNSDSSIKKLKGENRPINSQEKRIKQLDNTGLIDEIIVFNTDTPLELIKVIKPDIYVMGADYKGKEIAGSDLVSEIIYVDYQEEYSTSKIIERVINDI